MTKKQDKLARAYNSLKERFKSLEISRDWADTERLKVLAENNRL